MPGRPFIRNYNPRAINAAPSNWSIVQDQRGIMYFGNAEGILEFDGVSWRKITTPNRSVVRALAVDTDNRIYAGEVGNFGYLAPDSVGQLRYVSLLHMVPEQERQFADVLNAQVTSQGVYFLTYNALFRWDGKRVHVLKPGTSFQSAFSVRDTLYVCQKNMGLSRVSGDSIIFIAGADKFVSHPVCMMLPFSNHDILIGTTTSGLFIYNGHSFRDFQTKADYILTQSQLYRGIALNDGLFALGTLRDGIALIDREGRLLEHTDKSAGLQDEMVLAMQSDQQGGIWLGLFNGITRVESPSPLSIFGEESGLKGGVLRIIRHSGFLYAATGLGVFRLDESKPYTEAFQPVKNIGSQSWSFLKAGEDLLAATNDGVYSIRKDLVKNLGLAGASTLYRLPQDTTRILIGLTMGLSAARLTDGNWQEEGRFPGIMDEVRSIATEDNGVIWLGTKSQGVIRLKDVSFSMGPAAEHVDRFGTRQGLSRGEIHVFRIDRRILFTSQDGVFRFDERRQYFVPDSIFGSEFTSGNFGVEALVKDGKGNIWIVSTSEAGDEMRYFLRQPDQVYREITTPFKRVPGTELWAVFPEDISGDGYSSHIVWCGGADGLLRYDSGVNKSMLMPFPALIRRVSVNNEHLIFGGTAMQESPQKYFPELPPSTGMLRFEYSASAYDAETENQYQTYLEGFDEAWSPWKTETRKDYTNLPAGHYHFHVRARNVYKIESAAAVYSFIIAPPWYSQKWAYVLYGIMLVGGIFGIDRVQRRRLIRRERDRAETERREIELKKAAELKTAYDKLSETHEHLVATQQQLITQEKLASLGQLTAGIAHEIRNPLNFIHNFAVLSIDLANEFRQEFLEIGARLPEERRSSLEGILADIQQNADKINHHSKRADGIVKSMMQHARASSNQFELTNLNALLDESINLVYHGMRANDSTFNISIEKVFDPSLQDIPVVPQDISRVFLNIINNACYAMHHKRKSVIEDYAPLLKVTTRQDDRYTEVRIRDNGPGISSEIRNKIFLPFFSTKPTGEGTGLGLSISRDIVIQQHRGDLTVESEEGSFTEFIIRLPKAKDSD